MKAHEEGHAVILALVVFLACSGMILSGLHTAFVNRHIVYLDRSSLQAWQAADAGLAWAYCHLSERPFNHSDPLQGEVTLSNGALCQVTGSYVMAGTAREYSIICTGSYQGATRTVSRKITVLPPPE
ncbi:MAG: hypothetical protein ACOX0F_07035 [Syntrophomonadaceae bacterium]